MNIKKLIQEHNVKTTRGVQEILKDLFSELIQEIIESELDEQIVYDNQNKIYNFLLNRSLI